VKVIKYNDIMVFMKIKIFFYQNILESLKISLVNIQKETGFSGTGYRIVDIRYIPNSVTEA